MAYYATRYRMKKKGSSFWKTLTSKILIANIIIFFITLIPIVFAFLALTPQLAIKEGYVWQFFTYMYVHDTRDPMHIILNMFGLVMFGPKIEERLGKKKFFLFYTLCGIGSALLHILIEGIGMIPLVGASGAIFGILTAYGIFYPKNVVYLYYVPMPAIMAVGVLAFLQIFLGIFGGGAIAFWGHLGGMIVGLFLIKVFKFGQEEKPRVVYFWEVD